MCSDMEGSGPFCNERGCCQNAIIIKKLGCILSYYVIKTRELIPIFSYCTSVVQMLPQFGETTHWRLCISVRKSKIVVDFVLCCLADLFA